MQTVGWLTVTAQLTQVKWLTAPHSIGELNCYSLPNLISEVQEVPVRCGHTCLDEEQCESAYFVHANVCQNSRLTCMHEASGNNQVDDAASSQKKN